MIKEKAKERIYNVALKLPLELYQLVKIAAGVEAKTVHQVIIERVQDGFKVNMPRVPRSIIESQK